MSDEITAEKPTGPVAVREGIFTTPLLPLNQARLQGTHCRSCGESFLGPRTACENCGSLDVEEVVFSREGTLYTYTIIRNRPPGDYKGPVDPFEPFAEGLVELPEGIRLVSKLSGIEFPDIRIGMALELSVEKLFTDEDGRDVMEFRFQPRQGGK